MRLYFVAPLIIGITLLTGCAQKGKNWRDYFPFMKKKSEVRYAKKKRVHSSTRYFPRSIKLEKPLNPKAVTLFNDPSILGTCKPIGWLTLYVKPPLVYKSTLFRDILRTRKREELLIKNYAAKQGVRYVLNYYDEKRSKRRVVFDPLLKQKFTAYISPTKRVMVKNNKIYKISVRALKCPRKIP